MRDLRAFWNPVSVGPGRSPEGLKYGGFLRLFFRVFQLHSFFSEIARKWRLCVDFWLFLKEALF